MKLKQENYVEQEQLGNFKEITSTISEKNLSLVLDNVTKNLYSDPIGAFVRELTSNGVDANKRNSKSEKVKVHIYREGDSVYFEVKDEGGGMSPEVFEKVYMSWFESDKRNDSGQIGGWGIGSKSPLAYTEFYTLSTIHDGIQYDYEIVRQQPAPTATLLASFPTNKKSGTTVTVEVKQEDAYKLHKAAVRQLVYFDNVIVTDEIYYYDNHFKIIDHPNFIVRSDGNHPFSNDMHIVVGQVAYPIDWHILGLKPIRVPVALKFNIDDVPVNLNREVIHYKDDVIKNLIKAKIAEAKTILKELYLSRLEVDSISSYITAIRNPKTVIELAGYEIYFGIDMRDAKHFFTYKGENFIISKDNLNSILLAFEGIRLNKKEGSNRFHPYIERIVSNSSSYVFSESGELNHWSSLYRRNNSLIRRDKLSKQLVYKYASALGLTMERVLFGKLKTVLITGAIKKVFIFIKAMEEYLSTYLANYDNVPESFIQAEKDKQELLKEERRGNITYYNEMGNKTVVQLGRLIDSYQYVFYLSRAVSEIEQRAYTALYQSFDSKIRNRILFIIVSPTTISKLKNKVKDLTITQRVKINGKKEYVSTTKSVNAFLSAEKMFKYTVLYKQFHKLRYTTLLEANCFDGFRRGVSPYYENLKRTIPTTPNYTIQRSKDENRTTRKTLLYPYYYFQKEIDAITSNRNYHHEKALEELLKVAPYLFMLSKADDMNNDPIIAKHLIKTHKLTKLNPKYYDNI